MMIVNSPSECLLDNEIQPSTTVKVHLLYRFGVAAWNKTEMKGTSCADCYSASSSLEKNVFNESKNVFR